MTDLARTPDRMGAWLAGLVDGEGCFILDARIKGNQYKHINWEFKITLREDDGGTLDLAQRVLGGVGYRRTHEPSKGHPLATFGVNKRSEIRTVVDFFRYYPLRSKKRRDFRLWAEAFEVFESRRKNTPLKPSAKSPGQEELGLGEAAQPRPVMEFKRIPEDLFGTIKEYADRIREGREYRDPELAGETV